VELKESEILEIFLTASSSSFPSLHWSYTMRTEGIHLVGVLSGDRGGLEVKLEARMSLA